MGYGNHGRGEDRHMFPHTGHEYRYQPSNAATPMPMYEVAQPGGPPPRPLEPSITHPIWASQVDPRSTPATRNGSSSESRFDSDREGHRKQLPSIRDLMAPASASQTSSSPRWTGASYAYGASPYPSASASTVPHSPSDNGEPYHARNVDVSYGSQYHGQQHHRLAVRPVTGTTSSQARQGLNVAASVQGPHPDRLPAPPYLQQPPAGTHLQLRQETSSSSSIEKSHASLGSRTSVTVAQRSRPILGSSGALSGGSAYVNEQYLEGEGRVFTYEDGSYCKAEIDGERVNPAWGLTKAGRPRKRLAQACLPCREKKVKCEPGRGPERCMHCEKAHIPCRRPETPRSSDGSASTGPSPPRSTTTASRRSSAGKHRRGSHSSEEVATKRKPSVASGSEEDEQANSVCFTPASRKESSKAPSAHLTGCMNDAMQAQYELWGHVLAAAYHAVYRPDKAYREEYERSYAHAEQRLAAWMADLPSCLHYDQKNMEQSVVRGYVGTFVSLHALYHATVVQLNRNARAELLPASIMRRNIRTAREHARQLLSIIRTLYEADREASNTESDNDVGFAFSTPFPGFAIQCAVDVLSAGGLRTELAEVRNLTRIAHSVLQHHASFRSSAIDQVKAVELRLGELDKVHASFKARSRASIGTGSKESLASRCWRLNDPMEMEMGLQRKHDCMYGSHSRTFFEAITGSE